MIRSVGKPFTIKSMSYPQGGRNR